MLYKMITRREQSMLKMYFTRFSENILKDALHKKYITSEEFLLIQEFWNDSLLRDICNEDVEFLKSFGLELEIVENNFKITKFPYNKKMCLTVSCKNPRIWKYSDEIQENFLFGYIISTEKCYLVKDEKELSYN